MKVFHQRRGVQELLHFWCRGCDSPHSVPVKGSAGVNWDWNGDIHSPTLYHSVDIVYDEVRCYSWIREGKITYHPDSTHDLRGCTILMEEWEEGWDSESPH